MNHHENGMNNSNMPKLTIKAKHYGRTDRPILIIEKASLYKKNTILLLLSFILLAYGHTNVRSDFWNTDS